MQPENWKLSPTLLASAAGAAGNMSVTIRISLNPKMWYGLSLIQMHTELSVSAAAAKE